MDWLTFFADITKTLTWPIFGGCVALLFHKPISGFINRTIKIDKDGVTAISAPEAQREKQKPEAVQQLLDAIGKSIVITAIEDSIKDELKTKGLSTDGDSIDILIRHLAGTQLLLSFEQIHNLIFGSQIFLLKKLNEVAGQGRASSFVDDHFDHIKSLYPDTFDDWSVNQYLNFMFGHSLITLQSNQIHITNKGVEYLTWIARNGIPENKPL